MTIADPFGALADIIVGYHNSGIISKWGKLIFGILFSFWVSFNTVMGGCLIVKMGWPVSVGSGMVAGAAMALTAYMRANPSLTKGVVIAVPQQAEEDAAKNKPEVITMPGKP